MLSLGIIDGEHFILPSLNCLNIIMEILGVLLIICLKKSNNFCKLLRLNT